MSLLPYDPENPPAFPVMVKTPNGAFPEGGMTLRDYFAAGVLSNIANSPTAVWSCYDQAELAYSFSDAMLAARKPKTP